MCCFPPICRGWERLHFTEMGGEEGPPCGEAVRRAHQPRPQGMAKRLTLTERRLSFAFGEGTPRPEGQAFRAAVRWTIHFGLDSSVTSHQGEGTEIG